MAFVIDFTMNEFFESFMFLVCSFYPFVVISFHRNRFLSTFVLFSFILVFFLFLFFYIILFFTDWLQEFQIQIMKRVEQRNNVRILFNLFFLFYFENSFLFLMFFYFYFFFSVVAKILFKI